MSEDAVNRLFRGEDPEPEEPPAPPQLREDGRPVLGSSDGGAHDPDWIHARSGEIPPQSTDDIIRDLLEGRL